jgi:hypothetical protein
MFYPIKDDTRYTIHLNGHGRYVLRFEGAAIGNHISRRELERCAVKHRDRLAVAA